MSYQYICELYFEKNKISWKGVVKGCIAKPRFYTSTYEFVCHLVECNLLQFL